MKKIDDESFSAIFKTNKFKELYDFGTVEVRAAIIVIYWLHTTAPPVASADKIWISRTLMLSTNDTPDTAASPHEETISVSNSPMLKASACSIMSGTISFFKSSLVKSNDSIFPSKKCGTASRHATNDCHSIVLCSVRIMPVQP